MSDPTEQPLQPAAFSPRAPAGEHLGAGDRTGKGSGKRPAWLIPGIAVAVVAVLLVFIGLPMLVADKPNGISVSAQTKEGGQTSGASSEQTVGGAQSSPSAPDISPFADAQRQKQRRAAQEALQTVLELQEILTELNVTQWADEEYAAALVFAETGDVAYREGDFVAAATAYQDAGEALVALEATLPERTQQAIDGITAAVEAGDEPEAQQLLDLLKTVSPGNTAIATLQQRITAMPAVAAALETAAQAASEKNYARAIEGAETAIEADPDHVRSQEALARYRQLDADQRFRKAMSEGYFDLEEGRFDSAETAFKRAATIRREAPEPQAALGELAAARTADTLRRLQETGIEQEQQEAWQEAVATYQRALDIDSSLTFAQQGMARATPRATLEEDIERVLDEPERLVDSSALRTAEGTLVAAREIPSAGPVLSKQVDELAAIIRYAKTPVEVAISSDGVTDVTVLRVKRLGAFSNSTVTLRPGKYTALGVRTGFRDVRIDFEVKPGEAVSVDVRCLESI